LFTLIADLGDEDLNSAGSNGERVKIIVMKRVVEPQCTGDDEELDGLFFLNLQLAEFFHDIQKITVRIKLRYNFQDNLTFCGIKMTVQIQNLNLQINDAK
jgi:hypothetical protein